MMVEDITRFEFQGVVYYQEHGNFFDRGSADSYYNRKPTPHRGGVGGDTGPRRLASNDQERAEYMAGYGWNEQFGHKK